MSKNDLLKNCTERLLELKTPTEEQHINVIPTPFDLDGEPILLGKRSQGHLVALFPDQENKFSIPGGALKLSNGFELLPYELKDNKKLINFLEFRNVGNIDLILFGALLDEVLMILDSQKNSPIEAIKSVLERWKHILSLDSDRVMPVNKLIGLMGELLLLDHLTRTRHPNILNNWVGPLGNRHDFEFVNNSIEVKSTTTKIGNEISVHGINQLEPYPGKKVSVLRVKFEPDPAGISLPDLIKCILKTEGVSTQSFNEKLLKVGYRHEFEKTYTELRFQPVEFQIIPVDSKFPRITKNDLQNLDVTSRILDIQYVVNVSGLETQKSATLSAINFQDLL